jgi:hypothetical protein
MLILLKMELDLQLQITSTPGKKTDNKKQTDSDQPIIELEYTGSHPLPTMALLGSKFIFLKNDHKSK